MDLASRTTAFSACALDVTRAPHVEIAARFDRTVVRDRDFITPPGGPASLDGDARKARVNHVRRCEELQRRDTRRLSAQQQ